jgi:RNA polymerase sigma-70 factor (ECF subfamily)
MMGGGAPIESFRWSLAERETPPPRRESCYLQPSLSLFYSVPRIPVRMSAAISCLTPHRSSFFGHAAMPGPTLFFSTLMSDEAKSIARGLQKRDPDLLDRLIEQYQYRLFRYLVYITGSRERAEDFFQETWIRVLERGHQYDGKSKFEAWLFAIARHLVIDWQRSKKPQSLDSLTDPEQEHPLQLVNETEPSALHQILSHETEENVQASLQKIPAIYREVLALRFQEELQIEEMAGVLSIPVSTVKSRLYRGLEALRGALQGGAAL